MDPTHEPEGNDLSADLRLLERKRPFRAGLAVGTVVSVATAFLIIQNGRATKVHWLWLNFESPLWLLIVVTLAAGALIGEVAKLTWRHARARARTRRQTLKTARRRLDAP